MNIENIKKAENLLKVVLKAKIELSGEESVLLAQSIKWFINYIQDMKKPDVEILDGKDNGITKREV